MDADPKPAEKAFEIPSVGVSERRVVRTPLDVDLAGGVQRAQPVAGIGGYCTILSSGECLQSKHL